MKQYITSYIKYQDSKLNQVSLSMISLYRRRPLNLCIFIEKPRKFGSRVRFSYLISIFEFITTVSVIYITHVKLYMQQLT